ncbi:MAG: ATP-dependent Clp protease adaptor ClpS [Flavobacteriaceae bacterium]
MSEVAEPIEKVEVEEKKTKKYQLVLFNDDFNTFDFVIECLIHVCEHTLEQAEQCTMLVHYKGKCTVKTGELEVLKPKHKKLGELGLTAEII